MIAVTGALGQFTAMIAVTGALGQFTAMIAVTGALVQFTAMIAVTGALGQLTARVNEIRSRHAQRAAHSVCVQLSGTAYSKLKRK